MSGPYQGRDLSNCGVGRLRVAINCGVLSVKATAPVTRKQLSVPGADHEFERSTSPYVIKLDVMNLN